MCVHVCVCVCVCVGRLIIFCTAKDDLAWPNSIHRVGCSAEEEEEEEEEEIEFSQAANGKKTDHPFLFFL